MRPASGLVDVADNDLRAFKNELSSGLLADIVHLLRSGESFLPARRPGMYDFIAVVYAAGAGLIAPAAGASRLYQFEPGAADSPSRSAAVSLQKRDRLLVHCLDLGQCLRRFVERDCRDRHMVDVVRHLSRRARDASASWPAFWPIRCHGTSVLNRIGSPWSPLRPEAGPRNSG